MLESTVREHVAKVADEQLAEAIEAEIRLAEENGDFVFSSEGVKYWLIRISADGAWPKRPSKAGGASAKFGYVSLIGVRTGVVVAYGSKNLYCSICCKFLNDRGEVDTLDPTFPQNHQCSRNFNYGPGNMEAVLIVELMESLFTKHHIIIPEFVGDADSSVLAEIQKKNLYASFNIQTKRIQCYLHMTRNFENKVRQVKSSALKAINYADKMKSFARNIISDCNSKLNGENRAEMVRELELRLAAAPFHFLNDHSACSSQYCTRTDGDEILIVSLDEETKLELMVATSTLVTAAGSLIEKLTTNLNENFNAIVNKYNGEKRISFKVSGTMR